MKKIIQIKEITEELTKALNLENAEEITILVKRKPVKNPDMAKSRAKADEVFTRLTEKMEELEESMVQKENTPEQCEYCEHNCEDDNVGNEENMDTTCLDYMTYIDDKIDDIMGEIADIKENVNNLTIAIPASFDLLETRLGVAPRIKKKGAKEIVGILKKLESEVCTSKWTSHNEKVALSIGIHETISELKQAVADNGEILKGLVKDIEYIKDKLSVADKNTETSDEPIPPAKKSTSKSSTKKSAE